MAGEVYGFDKQSAQNIRQAARQILTGGNYGSVPNATDVGGNQCITAKLLSQIGDATTYTWRQERRTGSSWETIANGLSDSSESYPAYTLDETNTTDLSDTHVILVRVPVNDGDTKIAWVIAGGASASADIPQGVVFAVLCTAAGGSAGAGGAITLTYSCTTLDGGTTLGGGAPQYRPMANGNVTPGTRGVAYYDDTSSFKLWSVNEVYDTFNCPSPP